MSLTTPQVPALQGEFNQNRNARYLTHSSWEEILSLPCQTATVSATFFITAGASGRTLGEVTQHASSENCLQSCQALVQERKPRGHNRCLSQRLLQWVRGTSEVGPLSFLIRVHFLSRSLRLWFGLRTTESRVLEKWNPYLILRLNHLVSSPDFLSAHCEWWQSLSDTSGQCIQRVSLVRTLTDRRDAPVTTVSCIWVHTSQILPQSHSLRGRFSSWALSKPGHNTVYAMKSLITYRQPKIATGKETKL